MTADDDLRRAWAEYTLRFADPHDPARHSDTTIRDAFVSGWEAALAARPEPRAEGLREALREALRGTRCQPDEPELDAIYRRILAATPPAEGLREALARAFSQGYRAGLANEVDDWNASDEAVAEYGRQYAARAPEQPE